MDVLSIIGIVDETIITFFKHLSAQLKTLQNNNSLTVMFSDMEIPEGDCVIGWTQEGPQDTDNLNKILIENGYIIKEKIEKPFYFIGGETLERD